MRRDCYNCHSRSSSNSSSSMTFYFKGVYSMGPPSQMACRHGQIAQQISSKTFSFHSTTRVSATTRRERQHLHRRQAGEKTVITSKNKKVADLCSRWSKASSAEKTSIIAAFTRLQPKSWVDIGIIRRPASRPELFDVMDIWVPQKDGNDHSWMPPPLRQRF